MSEAKAAILRLMNEYTYRIDSGDLEGFASLFEHASFEVLGDPNGALIGKDGVLGLLQNVTEFHSLKRETAAAWVGCGP
jgi:hypothetical protein